MRAILSLEFVDDTVARSTTREVSMVLTKDEGRSLAEEWIASWNSRDLDRILSHYTDDLEFSRSFFSVTHWPVTALSRWNWIDLPANVLPP